MKSKKYTDEQFIDAVKKSTSIAHTLRTLGLKPAGSNYRSFIRMKNKLNIDISHFHGQSWSKGKKLSVKTTTEKYLSNRKEISSYKLKNRLLNEGYFAYRCMMCRLDCWLGKPIPLELHHIDGDSKNNLFSNLQILCPNCHAFTPNYRGKNKSFHS